MSQLVFPEQDEYIELTQNEVHLYKKYKYAWIWHVLQMVAIFLQGLFLYLYATTIF